MISRKELRMSELIRLFVIGLFVNESRDCKKKEMINDCDEFFAFSTLFSSIKELIVSSDCASFSCNDNMTWEVDWLNINTQLKDPKYKNEYILWGSEIFCLL